jgi:hypothetical protein
LVACIALLLFVPQSVEENACARTTTARLPEVVRIVTADGRSCTGTFIAKDVVLSAAHCFVGLGARDITVNEEFQVTKLLIHPEYSVDEPVPCPFDVALLEIDGEHVAAPIAHRSLSPAEDITFVGFGDSRTSRSEEPAFKRIGEDVYMPSWGASPSGVESSVARSLRRRGLLYFEAGPSDVGSSLFGAAVTRGDSGGPIFDSSGSVTGVIVAVSQVEGASAHRITWGVDLAHPANRAFLIDGLVRLGAQELVIRPELRVPSARCPGSRPSSSSTTTLISVPC